jgi:hypothetical protein
LTTLANAFKSAGKRIGTFLIAGTSRCQSFKLLPRSFVRPVVSPNARELKLRKPSSPGLAIPNEVGERIERASPQASGKKRLVDNFSDTSLCVEVLDRLVFIAGNLDEYVVLTGNV